MMRANVYVQYFAALDHVVEMEHVGSLSVKGAPATPNKEPLRNNYLRV